MALIKFADQIYLGGGKGLFVLYFQCIAHHEEKSVQELIKHEPEAENIDQCCFICVYVRARVCMYVYICLYLYIDIYVYVC